MSIDPNEFGRSVFLNCPFDAEYRPLLQAQVFTILDCGFRPRIASEQVDSGKVRFEKIRDLIQACRFSIHDISRIGPLRDGDLPRFNMPFELGLDLGCRCYGNRRSSTKQCLILESEPYRYRQVLSDLSGHDVRAHENDAKTLISEVRAWLSAATETSLPSGSRIWHRFSEFTSHLQLLLKDTGFTSEEIEGLGVTERIQYTESWIQKTPAS